ncbi:hypothetical protein BGZ65_010447, partial [Modicella reniformis]
MSTSSSTSQATKLALVALVASFTTTAVILSFQGSQRKRRVKQLKDELHKSMPPPPIFDASRELHSNNLTGVNQPLLQAFHGQQLRQKLIQDESFAFDTDLIQEQMGKTIEFFGQERFEKLRNSFVIIVGAGKVDIEPKEWSVAYLDSAIMSIETTFAHPNILNSTTSPSTGGVGSWAANMLIRSGVGKIRLIDFDQVSLSSLNRHATAVQADV